jgi:ribosomal protein S18 acetylase RimI-like enzyme
MPMTQFQTKVVSPHDATILEQDRFAELVNEGDEVAGDVQDRIHRARSLILISDGNNIQAVAALKNPYPNYARRVFRSAGRQGMETRYAIELGWIFVATTHRRMGLAGMLVEKALEVAGQEPMFATTRSSNPAMLRILERNGFVTLGTSFPSSQHEGEELNLLVRNPSRA